MAGSDKSMNRQQQAINDYLQALLNEVDEEPPARDAAVTDSGPQVIGLDQLVETVPDAATETRPETGIAEAQQQVVEEAVSTPVETASVLDPQSIESPVPDWAEHEFQCLLFKVSGLTLAVPLVKLNNVVPWNEKIVNTPNRTDWYLGLVNHHGKNVKVIDTALMVLPENRRHLLLDDAQQRSSHILLVDDYNWGLACDEIGDVVWLSADDVKWRKNKRQRPWLAGTAIQQMCALIDTEVFADMLNMQIADNPAD